MKEQVHKKKHFCTRGHMQESKNVVKKKKTRKNCMLIYSS